MKGITKIQVVVIAIVIIIAAVAGGYYYYYTTTIKAVPSEIKIGYPISLTGFLSAFYARPMQWLVKEWENEVNAKGGIYLREYGKKLPVRVIIGDDESSPEKGVEVTTKLITRDDVCVLYSNGIMPIVLAELEVAERYGVPYLANSGYDTPYLERAKEKPWKYSWFFVMSMEVNVKSFVNLFDKLPSNKVVALHCIDTSDGVWAGEAWQKIAPPRGYTIIHLGYFPEGTMDFSSYIAKWKESKPDIIYSGAPSPFLQELLRQLKKYGYWPKIVIGQMAFFAEDVAGAGDTLGNGVLVPLWWHHTYPSVSAQLAEKYMATYNEYYRPNLGNAYACIQVIADAIERAGSLDRDAINKALSETDLSPTTGTIRFKFDPKTRVCIMPVVAAQWLKGGKYGWHLEVVYSDYDFVKPTATILYPLPSPF
ncbi:MAG: ABC transporter substrate-binding protein [candidate division WOR-3 bacterium]